MQYTIGTKVFNDWKITRLLGQGANGKVFELEKDNFNILTKSALKVIRIEKSETDIKTALSEGMDEISITEYYQGFVNEIVKEIVIMSELKSHSNIVSYEDHCVLELEDNKGWEILIRMELLTSLSDYLVTHKMTEADVLKLGIDLCNALTYCQKKGLIHRDIKPDNIFVNEEGMFELGDFGIARTIEKTMAGMSKKGTENYMAPEVYLGKAYGMQVDIYSIGIVLYRLMNNNRLPFYPPVPNSIKYTDRENALIKRMRGEEMPSPVTASDEFSKIILKACEYNPQNRYQTAQEMLDDMKRLYVREETSQLAKDQTVVLKANKISDNLSDVTIKEDSSSNEHPKLDTTNEHLSDIEKAWEDYKKHNYNEALYVFKKYAESGDASAQLILSNLYSEGHGVSQDNEKAEFWLKSAVDKGNVQAQFTYGMKLIASKNGDKNTIDKGLYYLNIAAEQGDLNAMVQLIETICKGNGNSKIIAKAISYCNKLIETSNSSAEKQKYIDYQNKLTKVMKRAKTDDFRYIFAITSIIVGSLAMILGSLYIFSGENPDLWEKYALLNNLPAVNEQHLLPIDAFWNVLKKYLSLYSLFGLEIILGAIVLFEIGNINLLPKYVSKIKTTSITLSILLLVWHLVMNINAYMKISDAIEQFMNSTCILAVSLLIVWIIGSVVGSSIRKILLKQ